MPPEPANEETAPSESSNETRPVAAAPGTNTGSSKASATLRTKYTIFPKRFSLQWERLERELHAEEIILGPADLTNKVVRELVGKSREMHAAGRTDSGWHLLHAARRKSLTEADISQQVVCLKEEAEKKMKGWRGALILKLLKDDPKSPSLPALSAVVEAARIRDEWAENQYFKIAALRRQLITLCLIAVCALALLLLLFFHYLQHPPRYFSEYDWAVVSATFLFATLGAVCSAGRSVTRSWATDAITVRLADALIATSRAILGAVPSLLLHAVLRGKLINLDLNWGTLFALAFVSGFSERFVVDLAQAVSGGATSK